MIHSDIISKAIIIKNQIWLLLHSKELRENTKARIEMGIIVFTTDCPLQDYYKILLNTKTAPVKPKLQIEKLVLRWCFWHQFIEELKGVNPDCLDLEALFENAVEFADEIIFARMKTKKYL